MDDGGGRRPGGATILLGGSLLVLLATAVFGHPFAHWRMAGLPVTLDRLALAILAVAYAVVRWRGAVPTPPLRLAETPLLALLAWLSASLALSPWWVEPPAPGDAVASFRLMTGYAIPAALFWVGRQGALDARAVRLLHRGLAVGAIYLGGTAVLEIAGPAAAVFPSHVMDPALGIHLGRARGPMLQSVSLGLALTAGAGALVGWRAVAGPRAQRVLGWLLAVPIAGIGLTYTRSVWLGATLGLALVVGLGPRGGRRFAIPAVLAAGVIVALATSVGSAVNLAGPRPDAWAPAPALDRIVDLNLGRTAHDSRVSVQMRGAFTAVSWRMFLDHPLAGVGFGGFPKSKLPYLEDRTSPLDLEAIRPYVHHSTLLSVLTETGAIGLALFLAVIGAWTHAAWRLARARRPPDWVGTHAALTLGVLAMWAVQLLFHEVSYLPLDNALVFLLAGVTTGLRGAALGHAPPARIAPRPASPVPAGSRSTP